MHFKSAGGVTKIVGLMDGGGGAGGHKIMCPIDRGCCRIAQIMKMVDNLVRLTRQTHVEQGMNQFEETSSTTFLYGTHIHQLHTVANRDLTQ